MYNVWAIYKTTNGCKNRKFQCADPQLFGNDIWFYIYYIYSIASFQSEHFTKVLLCIIL